MKELNVQQVAMVTGCFLGGWHVVWSVLVLIGLAQPLMDFIFWVHMINNPYQVTPFTFTQSLTLIIVTFVVGYIGGWIFGWLWNKLHR